MTVTVAWSAPRSTANKVNDDDETLRQVENGENVASKRLQDEVAILGVTKAFFVAAFSLSRCRLRKSFLPASVSTFPLWGSVELA